MESIRKFVRTIVSGKRVRTKQDGYDLDLTYITPRILAMSFPADRFIQKIYRNNIQHVAQFLKEKHGGNYEVYNLSGTVYDATPFDGKVRTYQWEDHHSPTLVLLSEACQSMFEFLTQSEDNVVVIHCNAGKGRTGTLICCYLQFCGFADSAQNAITYYGWKRFKHGLGVTQPSQVRYIFYFEKVLQGLISCPKRVTLDKMFISNLPTIKRKFQIQAQLYNASDYSEIYKNPENEIEEMDAGDNIFLDFEDEDVKLCGDVFIKIMHLSNNNNHKQICRFGINTSFLKPMQEQEAIIKQIEKPNKQIKQVQLLAHTQDQRQEYKMKLDRFLVDPKQLQKNEGYANPDFKLLLAFTDSCNNPECGSTNKQAVVDNVKDPFEHLEQQETKAKEAVAPKEQIRETHKQYDEDDDHQECQINNSLVTKKKHFQFNGLCQECLEQCPKNQIDDWNKINEIREDRAEKLQYVDSNFGKVHMFTHELIDEYDYHDIIVNKSHDNCVYGRYTEIEKLGQDIDIPDNKEFYNNNSSIVRISKEEQIISKSKQPKGQRNQIKSGLYLTKANQKNISYPKRVLCKKVKYESICSDPKEEEKKQSEQESKEKDINNQKDKGEDQEQVLYD